MPCGPIPRARLSFLRRGVGRGDPALGVYQGGLIADCVRWVSPGEKAFGRTYEELLQTRGSFEAESGEDD